MPPTIVRFSQEHIDGVRLFNQRLKNEGIRFQFPENPNPLWLPKSNSDKLYQEFYVAADDSNVNGAYVLKHQDFLVNGKVKSIGNYGLPLSEGIIDRRFNATGLRLLNDALTRQPDLYALGMGGLDRPLPRFLKSMGWKLKLVPFYFYVVHSKRFFSEIQNFKQTRFKTNLANFMSLIGIGNVGVKLWQWFNTKFKPTDEDSKLIDSFGDWADYLWEEANGNYSLCAVRTSEFLNVLYPSNNGRFIRLKVLSDSNVVGWAVVLDTKMSDDKYFGNLRVGSMVDCMALNGFEKHVVFCAKKFLIECEVDLIVTNQSHNFWRDGCEQNGFMKGPSNFALALSPQLWQSIVSSDKNWEKVHFTRGDGDGPINL